MLCVAGELERPWGYRVLDRPLHHPALDEGATPSLPSSCTHPPHSPLIKGLVARANGVKHTAEIATALACGTAGKDAPCGRDANSNPNPNWRRRMHCVAPNPPLISSRPRRVYTFLPSSAYAGPPESEPELNPN